MSARSGVTRSRGANPALALFAAAVFLAVSTACGCAPAPADEAPAGASGDVATSVPVTTRTISSVLVLDAVVVANPVFRVTAPTSGVLVVDSGGAAWLSSAGVPDQPVSLPPSSRMVGLLLAPGSHVSTGTPILDAQLTGFALQATVPPERLFRLYDGVSEARGEISGGSGPVLCTVLGAPFPPGAGTYWDAMSGPEADAPPTGGAGASYAVRNVSDIVVVIAALPADTRALEGSPGLLALKTAEQRESLCLPVEAVAGIRDCGQVYVIADGSMHVREVTLGITDGSYVQILSGLSVGDRVGLPSPSIAALR